MKHFLIIILLFLSISSFCQNSLSNYSTQELEEMKKQAVQVEDYDKAAKYQDEINRRKQDQKTESGNRSLVDFSIEELEKEKKEAVLAEDYEKAAMYQEAIELRKEMNAAVQKEDYERAATLKDQLARLGGKGTGSTKESSPQTNSTYSGSAPSVEFINQVYLWNKSENTTTSLEKDQPEMKTKTYSGWGYAESKSFWVIEEPESHIKVKQLNQSFIVKVSPGMDPSDLFRLVRFEVIDGRRHIPYIESSSGAWVGGKTEERHDNDIDITFQRIDEGVYAIEIIDEMLPAEYGFFGLNKTFSFSLID